MTNIEMTVSAHGAVSKTGFPSHQPCLCIGFKYKLQAGGLPLSTPNVRLLHSRDTGSRGPPPHPHQQTLGVAPAGLAGCCEGPHAGGSLALSGGLGAMFRAAASSTCLRGHPRFSPAWHWLPADAFPCWNGNVSGRAEETQTQ